MNQATTDLYAREMTRIIAEQNMLNRRIAKLESAIRYGREIPENPPKLDIHAIVESVVLGRHAGNRHG